MQNIILYDCITGSRAYGLVTPASDYDHRRIVAPKDLSYYFGLNSFDVGNVVTTHEEDNTDYSARRFIDLVTKCNTVMLELLFAPKDCQQYVDDAFRRYFLDNRHKFLTKQIHKSVWGYAIAEHKRAQGLLTRNLGSDRKEDIKKYGYSIKNASHCIRLLHCATQALLTGEYPVRLEGPVREICFNLKQSLYPKERYIEFFNTFVDNLDEALEKSTLPEELDNEFMNDLLVNFHVELFGADIDYLHTHLTEKRQHELYLQHQK